MRQAYSRIWPTFPYESSARSISSSPAVWLVLTDSHHRRPNQAIARRFPHLPGSLSSNFSEASYSNPNCSRSRPEGIKMRVRSVLDAHAGAPDGVGDSVLIKSKRPVRRPEGRVQDRVLDYHLGPRHPRSLEVTRRREVSVHPCRGAGACRQASRPGRQMSVPGVLEVEEPGRGPLGRIHGPRRMDRRDWWDDVEQLTESGLGWLLRSAVGGARTARSPREPLRPGAEAVPPGVRGRWPLEH